MLSHAQNAASECVCMWNRLKIAHCGLFSTSLWCWNGPDQSLSSAASGSRLAQGSVGSVYAAVTLEVDGIEVCEMFHVVVVFWRRCPWCWSLNCFSSSRPVDRPPSFPSVCSVPGQPQLIESAGFVPLGCSLTQFAFIRLGVWSLILMTPAELSFFLSLLPTRDQSARTHKHTPIICTL